MFYQNAFICYMPVHGLRGDIVAVTNVVNTSDI